MHPISFAVRFYFKECNLVVEKCWESIKRQNKELFFPCTINFSKILAVYQIFARKTHQKSTSCFHAALFLWSMYLPWKSKSWCKTFRKYIHIYCDCRFWLNCCGFIMVRGLQHIPHFYFQIDCISNIKSKWRTCFSFLTYYILRALQMKIAM